MNKFGLIIAASVSVALLGGCEDVRSALGQSKSAPDEFAVYSRAPLSLPPDYGLRPPAPGSSRPQEVEPRSNARRAVLGAKGAAQASSAPPPGSSPGIQVLLKNLGTENANPNIRATINRETTILAEEDKSFAEAVMFWNTPTQYGTVVDPMKEAKRIQENQALGRSITEGEVPTIERKHEALLEGIF
ncbi:MAG: DUF3035 domain-containing protein [Rhodospirillales bacterium]|jgi:hypothetical protein|nr:DUF3035 domain-containing protein [Rhodospirillales bacterium]MDP7652225.1 DUF3035 domain-containing protein [Rhodospirillales bacterium]HJO97620.1 DUF3035 domain-containing protein [Rhodospirillales bacterium]